MDRWILTAISLPFLAAAVVISVRFGRLPVARATAAPADGAPRITQSLRFVRGVAVSLTSGLIAGVAVAGVGGRLMMRFAAATSPASAQGAITAADETVGRVTFGGSLFLIAFLGVLAAPPIGLAYRVLRRWLPGNAATAGIAVAAIAAALFGRAIDLTSPSNKDFAILRPRPFIAAMILGLIVLYGTTLGAAHEWVDGRLPVLSKSWRTWPGYAGLAFSFLDFFLMPVVALGTLLAYVVPIGATDGALRAAPARVGRWCFGVVSAAAGAFVLSDLVRIAT